MAREKVTFRFDMTNRRAEELINRIAAQRVTRITADIREAVKQAILAGYEQGQHPFDIALDLVGRIGPGGKRVGGIIGMTAPQEKASDNYFKKLISGDPEQMRDALGYELRDKRFDSTVIKAIDEGGSVDVDDATRMYDRYVDNALKLRGDTVARTETGKAVHAAAHEAFNQGLEKTGYGPEAVTRIWRTAGDDKVRDSHASMDGQTVQGLNTPFVSGDGGLLMHPLDDSLGAGPGDIINCRCDEEINIDFAAGIDLSEDQ